MIATYTKSRTLELGVLYSVRVKVMMEDSLIRQSRMEARSNTSTVTLRVVGGDEKGSRESETVKYSHESRGTRTRE
jgi:hypothetical protein